MIDKLYQREQRGQISTDFEKPFHGYSDDALIAILENTSARERTAAANLLGDRKCVAAIQPLCRALEIESALYSRISICEALAEIGLPALPHLIALLGCIGSNQHTVLPQKGFYKKSYPLPRDTAARTIIRIGVPALDALENTLAGDDRTRTLEGVDAIGHISFHHQTTRSLSVLMDLFHKYPDDSLLRWKIVRAFSAFPAQAVTDLLEDVFRESPHPALRWEAVRSLGLQKRNLDLSLIEMVHADPHEEVRQVAERFLLSNQ